MAGVGSRAGTAIRLLLLFGPVSGFDWPGRAQPAVSTLTQVREPAARDVQRDRRQLLTDAQDGLPERRVSALDQLDAADAASARVLAAALRDEDAEVVLAALRGYARSERAPSAKQLTALLDAADPRVVQAAALAQIRQTAQRGAPVWPPFAALPVLERTADPTLQGQEAEQVLAQLERMLAPGETLAIDPLLAWRDHAPAALRPRIAQLIARMRPERAAAVRDEPPVDAHEVMRTLADDPSPLRRIAALRASVSLPEARALRTALVQSDDARVAATAIVASALAGDALPADWLLGSIGQAPWPVGPAAAFALASASDAVTCTHADAREPIAASNLLAAIARDPAAVCFEARAIEQLTHGASVATRLSAALVLRTRTDRSPAMTAALARCARRDRDARVRAACAGDDLPALALRPESEPRALVLSDGRVIVSWPDGSGSVTWPRVHVVARSSAWLPRNAD